MIAALGFFGHPNDMSKNVVPELTPLFPPPTSFDPLDADQTNNLWVMRMINSSILEVDIHNKLTSDLLSSFEYNTKTKQIVFKVRPGLKFSDGSPISTEDIAFTIARMAFARPQFPVLSSIAGLFEWKSQANALSGYPSGLKINGDTIQIQLEGAVDNPLFRFVLEVFSVVPKSSIDLATNKLKMPEPPTSGLYKIFARDADSIDFGLIRQPISHGIKVHERIRFTYIQGDPNLEDPNLPEHRVFAGLEVSGKGQPLRLLENGFNVQWTPAASYAALIINPRIPPFSNVECRQAFASAFRESVASLLGPHITTEPSVFPLILPGYLTSKQLSENHKSALCPIQNFPVEIPWTKYPEGVNDLFNQAMTKTSEKLGLKLKLTGEAAFLNQQADAIDNDQSAFGFIRSGFWPLDPVGDIRMLFSPNLHRALKVVWSDRVFLSEVDRLGTIEDSDQIKLQMERINRYLYDHALFNTMIHFRRFFASRGKNTMREIPLAVQQPYAWQIFNVE